MRGSTIAAAVLIAVSTAALAQVARGPDAKNEPLANVAPANSSASNSTSGIAMANDEAPAAGSDTKIETPAPRR